MTQNNEREDFESLFPKPKVFSTFNEQQKLMGQWLDCKRGWETAIAYVKKQNEQQPKQIPDGWKPIETAKKEYGYILAFEAGHGIKITWWDSKHDNVGGWRCHGHGWRPTHWQPLPLTPSETNTEVWND